MKVKKVFWLITIVFVLTSVCLAADAGVKSPFINPFTKSGNWYKTNLHTHSTTSDGKLILSDVVKKYRSLGYNVLAITDHEKSNDVNGYSDANFILISGMETHPKCHTASKFHLVCLNLPAGFVMPKELEVQQRIDLVKKVGGEVIFAHPYWSGHTINEIAPLNGIIGLEVYNNTCYECGKGISSVQWDDVLKSKKYIAGFANDDMHEPNIAGGGWNMVKAEKLTPDAVMKAIKAGCFYSTSGPKIEDFRVEGNKVYLRCSPAKEIRLIDNAHGGQIIRAKGSQLLTKFEKEVKNSQYVRAEIVDVNDKCAWTNPILIEQTKKKKE
jgi:hypothetical protein